MRVLGICLGASTVSIVDLSRESTTKINNISAKTHEGNPKKCLKEGLAKLDLSVYDNIAVTGRKFRQFVNLPSLTEPEAVEYAFDFVNKEKKNYNAIVSAGGETFMVYALDGKGKISNVYTGNKCASGTGEFFLQQIRRMNLNINESIEKARSSNPYQISGRCSVFCKSDCTHALNKGREKGEVTAGLCKMISKKIIELLDKVELDKVDKEKVMIIGGASQNSVVMDYLSKEINIDIPEQAQYFEALGAGLWALEHKEKNKIGINNLYIKGKTNFVFLPKLKDYEKYVTFKTIKKGKAKKDDKCIIGLDVGSTTTKAVVLRINDNKILADVYLRTNGNPVEASRKCYASLNKKVKENINIVGLGVTGSGRQIAGLHSLTEGIINEIIAHATAAVYFDKDVDTIFEIGGQDAKYTYITNSVPSDYAMNEACSAGTGSFLEESAKESLGIDVEKIADISLKAKNPPNFNDQCAAFISSDIKNASHEGISKEDIVAGLVYSICMNYINRVKGAKPVGNKIFMQGGVCYNKAVPIAMAALLGREIIVPPDPGLIGAFGVALEIKERLNLNLLKEQKFNLKELAEREVTYIKPFKCKGIDEKCDRNCEIAMIKIKDKVYPFGGACNKYYNLRFEKKYNSADFNSIDYRQKLVFETNSNLNNLAKTIGINRSFLTNTYYPFYYNFFTKLGLKVVLPATPKEGGINRQNAAFCYPLEIAHGLFEDLLEKNPDYIFLPHILELPVENIKDYKKTCVFVQSEPYILKTAFKDKLKNKKIISPILNFEKGLKSQEKNFIEIAEQLGFNSMQAKEAFGFAIKEQDECSRKIKEAGKRILEKLEKNADRFAIVLFGRSYNAFAKEANLGIPDKIASRGIKIIPLDFLPYENEKCDEKMYWAMGQVILKAAQFVKKHKQLYAAYVTNFSCGPDSFLIGYFRDIMGIKPSLTLELDSHTADAGLDTRIEAFIDIIKSYRELEKGEKIQERKTDFRPAEIKYDGSSLQVISSDNKTYNLNQIHLIYPSMGIIGTQALAAASQSLGINSTALPPADYEVLKLGRADTTGKECLPLILTTGSLLHYLKTRKNKKEIVVFFMPESRGPCRFGQYNVFIRNIIKKRKIKNVAVLTLTDEHGYYGPLGIKFGIRAWEAITTSDVMQDIKNAILALATDKKVALGIFNKEWEKILESIKKNQDMYKQLKFSAIELSKIKLKQPLSKAKKIALVGEIYVRRDEISRQGLVEKLAEKGFVVNIAPVTEYVYYINYLARKKIYNKNNKLNKRIKSKIENLYIRIVERKIKKILSRSNLLQPEMIDIDKTIEHAKHLVNPKMQGEAIITIGLALREILHSACGVISIGPFGCMPSRVAESILTEEMTKEGKIKASKRETNIDIKDLPFLAIETDGNMFPQIIEAKIETLCLRARRVHEKMSALAN